MNEIVLDKKIINKFPSPYSLECAPNRQQADFREQTKVACLTEIKRKKLCENWLKSSKVVMVGDVSVGKTCLLNRYCRHYFESSYKTTIGVDFEVEKFHILGVPFILQIWDTAGQERFKSITQSYYRGANVLFIVFDLTRYDSLMNCQKWTEEALGANRGNQPFIFLIGTKRDLLSNIHYKNVRESAFQVAKVLNAEYWSVSSKTGKNVDKMFRRVAALAFDDVIFKSVDCDEKRVISIGTKLTADELRVRKSELQRFQQKCCQTN